MFDIFDDIEIAKLANCSVQEVEHLPQRLYIPLQIVAAEKRKIEGELAILQAKKLKNPAPAAGNTITLAKARERAGDKPQTGRGPALARPALDPTGGASPL